MNMTCYRQYLFSLTAIDMLCSCTGFRDQNDESAQNQAVLLESLSQRIAGQIGIWTHPQ
jgi:hypothetical protein